MLLKNFLKWFGKSGGQTLAGAHFSYRYISDEYFSEMIEEEIFEPGSSMKNWASDLLKENGFSGKVYLENSIVFMYHPEGTFHFNKSDEGENPPVYVYSRREPFGKIGPKILMNKFSYFFEQILVDNIEGQKMIGRI